MAILEQTREEVHRLSHTLRATSTRSTGKVTLTEKQQAGSADRLLAPADGFTLKYPDRPFDALLVLSFGGPEGREDVIPFLENVLRGRNVPRERLEEVAEHYYHFGGVSPINQQNRDLIDALRTELDQHGLADLPIYFGNRNWHPLLPDTLQQMAEDGVKKALVFITSVYSSYSGCRQYRENMFNAQVDLEGIEAPEILLTRKPFNHPGWIETQVDLIEQALRQLPEDARTSAHIIYSAHSIPTAMAHNCVYTQQLADSADLITERVQTGGNPYSLAYQSRSGPPHQPWLEPDINDHMAELKEQGVQNVVVVPLGFISDHMEVMYDLDEEALETAAELKMTMVRAGSAGTHPRFVTMVRELIEERLDDTHDHRPFVGGRGPSWDVCPVNCCLPGNGRPSP